MHRINYIQTNIQHICNIGPLIQWYSEKTKERCTTGSPQGICYRGYQEKDKGIVKYQIKEYLFILSIAYHFLNKKNINLFA